MGREYDGPSCDGGGAAASPGAALPVTPVYADRRNLPQRVQAFMGWVAQLLTPCLDPVRPPAPPAAPPRR